MVKTASKHRPEIADIVIVGAFRKTGGTYRRLLNQIHLWVEWGYRVSLVTFRDGVRFFPDEIPAQVDFHHLGTRGKIPTILALWRYLRLHRPRVVLSINHVSNVIVAGTWHLPGISSRRFLSVPNTFGQSEKLLAEPVRRERKLRQIRRVYRNADGVIAVSNGVRDDLVQTIGLRDVEVTRIYSGSIGAHVFTRAEEPVEHPWLLDKKLPVLLSVGRLVPQKDYPTLLRAFALVRKTVNARLIILGEGRDRKALEALADELQVRKHIDLPGFAENPYAYMSRADLFVLSSRWEGLVNVVIEAMAVGAPIVSTDCPSGPAEILAHGRYGMLVPTKDHRGLADAILATLRGDGPRFDHDEATRPFRAETAARAYLRQFGLLPSESGQA